MRSDMIDGGRSGVVCIRQLLHSSEELFFLMQR